MHGSLRPSFSMSSLSPRTTRSPRLTFVSDGYPLRRLLERVQAALVVVVDVVSHDGDTGKRYSFDPAAASTNQRSSPCVGRTSCDG